MTRRVVLYLRLSRASEASTAIQGQNDLLREYVDRRGWEVVRVLADDGLSGRKRRANADECLRMLADNEADVLAVYAVDRWTREGLEAVGELCGVLRRSGATFFALREGLSSDDADTFEMTLGIHASIAKREGELIQGRVVASRKRLDEAGRFKGGVVPFGYRVVRRDAGAYLEHDPYEVRWVRYIVDAVLEGQSLTSITSRLRAERVPTTKSAARKARQRGESTHDLDGGTWHLQIVRKLATSPTLVGWTTTGGSGVHDQERPIVRDRDGTPKVVAPPLIDGDTFARLRAALPPGRPKRTRAARLLSGLAYCECGAKCYVVHSGGAVFYRCSARASDQDAACTGPRILASVLEETVVAAYLRTYGPLPEFVKTERGTAGAVAELADLERSLADASAAMLEDGADLSAIATRIGALKSRRDGLKALPSEVTIVRTPTGRTLEEAWAALPDDAARRARLGAHLSYVEVGPASATNRARLEWHADEEPRHYTDADEDLDRSILSRAG